MKKGKGRGERGIAPVGSVIGRLGDDDRKI